MCETFKELELVNAFHSSMDDVTATRVPGINAIDHMWVSKETYNRITQFGIVSQDKIFLSNHMGMFVDIRIPKVNTEEEESKRVQRYLKSGDKKNVKKYLDYARRQSRNAGLKDHIRRPKRDMQRISDNEIARKLNRIDKKFQ